MGFFKKSKDGAGDQAKIGVAGMPVNPAIIGGPSTEALAPDDPLLQPIQGIGLAEYAAVAKVAQQRGVTTEDGMAAIAGELGHDPAVFTAASKEWIARMGQSMVVGQEFRRHLGY
ncbi:MAG: hypothetical protein MUE78_11700 [Ilumatobacteraceae bacterium]|nr:hypothetical protein [Ilumatobacteraceae bacterium]